MRFHLDEHVAHAIAYGLKRRGIDVTTATDAGLLSAPDLEHIAFALHEHRIIFTQDDDFLRPEISESDHAGIVYSVPGSRTIGEIIRHLTLMHNCLDNADMRGRVEYL